MFDFKKILIFLLVNFLGFFSVTICFLIGLQTGLFENLDENSAAQIQNTLFMNTSMTWLVCAVFSVSYFFLDGFAKYAFLWSAAVIPFLYGLSVLYL